MKPTQIKKEAVPYFEGWYFKQYNGCDTLAFIPSIHRNSNGDRYASLQVITDDGSRRLRFPASQFAADAERTQIQLENNIFSFKGCRLNLNRDGLQINGTLRYGLFTRPKYDIMGPFCLVPALQCRHSVFSYYHQVDGSVILNGRSYHFYRGSGYAEGDRGSSFPSRYFWTQCSWEKNCIMLSIADIPLKKLHFDGCIGSIVLNGHEYRLATYLRLKVLIVKNNFAAVRQGDLVLTAKLLEEKPHPLFAPRAGEMNRTVHESAACTVQYCLYRNGRRIFDLISDSASFESTWESEKQSS